MNGEPVDSVRGSAKIRQESRSIPARGHHLKARILPKDLNAAQPREAIAILNQAKWVVIEKYEFLGPRLKPITGMSFVKTCPCCSLLVTFHPTRPYLRKSASICGLSRRRLGVGRFACLRVYS